MKSSVIIRDPSFPRSAEKRGKARKMEDVGEKRGLSQFSEKSAENGKFRRKARKVEVLEEKSAEMEVVTIR